MTATTSSTEARKAAWSTQRILFLLAGTVTLTGIVLGVFISRWFLLLPALAGANQLLFTAVGWCPMSVLLRRLGLGDTACSRAER